MIREDFAYLNRPYKGTVSVKYRNGGGAMNLAGTWALRLFVNGATVPFVTGTVANGKITVDAVNGIVTRNFTAADIAVTEGYGSAELIRTDVAVQPLAVWPIRFAKEGTPFVDQSNVDLSIYQNDLLVMVEGPSIQQIATDAAASAAAAAANADPSYATVAAAQAATVPAGKQVIRVRGALSEGTGAADYYEIGNAGGLLKGQIQTNGATRRFEMGADYSHNIESHGAPTDGVSSASAVINAVAARYGRVFIPPRRFMGSVILPHGTLLEGAHREKSIIMALPGTNSTAIAGTNTYALFNTTTYDLNAGSNECEIRNLTVDGNRANVTSTGDGIAIWGRSTRIFDVTVENVRGNGIKTEWSDGNLPMEGSLARILVLNVGGHGVIASGPHDSNYDDIYIVDAGQNVDNTHYGFALTALAGSSYGNGRCSRVHVWHTSGASNRVAWAFYSGGTNEWSMCHAEGGRRLFRAGQQDQISLCRFYGHFGANGSDMLLLAGNDVNIGTCMFFNSGAANNDTPNSATLANGDVYAINFGSAGGCLISGSKFDGFRMRTPFNFATSAGFNSILGCRGYAGPGGATAFSGTPHANDEIDYYQGGTIINVRKPAAYTAYADNAAALAAGVRAGAIYQNSASNALTVRV